MNAPNETLDSPEVLARVREGMDLVAIIAKQVRRAVTLDISVDELTSYGHEGLLTAARKFDETRGVPFNAWAAIRVRGAMIDGVRQSGTLPRKVYAKLRALEVANETTEGLAEDDASRPRLSAEEADARLNDCLTSIATAMALSYVANGAQESSAPEGDTPEGLLVERELDTAIRQAVSRLPDVERNLVERHYYGEMNLDEAAREIGLSKSWGCRIHARAVEMLARDLKRNRVAR